MLTGRILHLKTEQPYVAEVALGLKRAELTLDDRHYAVGDILILNETVKGVESNLDEPKWVAAVITHILRDDPSAQFTIGLKEGYAMLSIQVVDYALSLAQDYNDSGYSMFEGTRPEPREVLSPLNLPHFYTNDSSLILNVTGDGDQREVSVLNLGAETSLAVARYSPTQAVLWEKGEKVLDVRTDNFSFADFAKALKDLHGLDLKEIIYQYQKERGCCILKAI